MIAKRREEAVMRRRMFGSELDSDFFESKFGYPALEGNKQKAVVPVYKNLPGFPQKPRITGGKIEVTDYFFSVPFRKRRVTWVNLHSGDGSTCLSELDVYAKILKIMKENELL